MAKKSIRDPEKALKKAALTIWDGPKFFDAEFTMIERQALRQRLVRVCGMDDARLNFEYEIERPKENELWGVAKRFGVADLYHPSFRDWVLIAIAKDVGVDYKNFSKNVPKLPIDDFIECAKRFFPDFSMAANTTQKAIQVNQLRALWSDWKNRECERTGCGQDSHWLCSDRYMPHDEVTVLAIVAESNSKRESLLKSLDAKPRGKSVKIANDALARVMAGAK
jgi:hypothetical protein